MKTIKDKIRKYAEISAFFTSFFLMTYGIIYFIDALEYGAKPLDLDKAILGGTFALVSFLTIVIIARKNH